MPWTQTDPMTERARFVLAYQDGLYSMTELCQRFGVSRKTGYKWLHRFKDEGLDGLADQSRAPKRCPHKTPPETEALIVACRQKHPRWGPKKLAAYLARRHPAVTLPATSTVGAILKRHGLIEPKRRRRPTRHPGAPTLRTAAPNEVWTTDFKGQFKTLDGIYCYPLTISDAHSRFVLDVQALASVKQKGTIPVFQQLFERCGLPRAIRTDNGVPFATQALCGLSKLSVWWIKLGIGHQRIEPGQPYQNGRHERMHRTLKAETARPPASNMATQQQCFDDWRTEFNTERPHEALSGETPASQYRPSSRGMPDQTPEPEYPAHWEVRRVSRCGTFRIKKRQLFLSQALNEEHIALEETGDGIWSLYFYDVLLARLDERDFKLVAAVP